MKSLLKILTAFALFGTSATAQVAGAPGLIDYQGHLLDGGGANLAAGSSANYEIHFRIWSDQSSIDAANLIWAEKQIVTVVDGQFSVRIGEGEDIGVGNGDTLPLVGNGLEWATHANLPSAFTGPTGDERYLGVTVIISPGNPAAEIQPRLRFLSVPYAQVAEKAKSVDDLAVGAAQITLASITNAQIAPDTLTSANIQDSTITSSDIEDESITGSDIDNGSITASDLDSSIGVWTTSGIDVYRSSGDVGIGTSSPGAKLHVEGTIEVDQKIQANDSGGLELASDDGTTRLRIVDNGNVGIGTSSPDAKLHVEGTIEVDQKIQANDSGGLELATDEGMTRVKIADNGNIGIGTSSPGSLLQLSTSAGDTNLLIEADTDNNNEADHPTITFSQDGGITQAMVGFFDDNNFEIRTHQTSNPATPVANAISIEPVNGTVGIGTSSPSRGKLDVRGSSNYYHDGWAYLIRSLGNDGSNDSTSALIDNGGWPSIHPVGIYSEQVVNFPQVIVRSDGRTKEVRGDSNSREDLKTLMSVEIVDYGFVDKMAHGDSKQKKVIAQQVEEVFPIAVTKSVNVVPDIYRAATIEEGWIDLETDLSVGEKVRLVGEGEEGVYEVTERSDDGFRTAFNPEGEHVFVFGREVDDFRNVDYDALAMLNISATQEVYRQLHAEQTRNAELEERIRLLEARQSACDTKFAKLEKLLEALPEARSVSSSVSTTANR